MLIGEYQHNLEEKGRLAIPAKLRKKDGLVIASYVITKGLERCLFMYPVNDFETKIIDKIKDLGFGNQDVRDFKRFILGSAVEIEPDGQGRFVIPQALREYAGIEKEITVSGMYDHIEIWDTASWNKRQHKIEADSGRIAGTMGDYGI